MSISSPTCHHLHPTGKPCGSPALRGEQFCFYHHPTRLPPTRTRPSSIPFEVPPIVDAETLQMPLSEVIRRLADQTLDTKRASLLLITLQMAKANLPALLDDLFQQPPTRDRAARTSPDLPDLSGLLAILGHQPTPAIPGH